MKALLRLWGLAALFLLFSMVGCATAPKPDVSFSPYASPWHGRLSLRISPDQGQEQSVSAEFDLTGNAQWGELTLYTPLGSTAAALTWSPQAATLRANGEVRQFASLDGLIQAAVGTDLPVSALFSWVAGENKGANGWRADLTDYAKGRIKANRHNSAPAAELLLILTR